MTHPIQRLKARAAVACHPLVQRIRSCVISACSWLMNLSGGICYADRTRPIGWRDHLRWWIEGKLSTLFAWAWLGSAEELDAVDAGEVLEAHMSARQRHYAAFIAAQPASTPEPSPAA